MATFNLSKDVTNATLKNNRSRNINDCFPYTAGTYKKITQLSREGGIWCNCGGRYQSVVLSVFDQLLDGETLIKTSNTTTCSCYGYGPNLNANNASSTVNYAETIFSSWTQAESDAAIKAWQSGTLKITRYVSVKSFTSPNHGSPTFRDGYYTDTITIIGDTLPYTNYGPSIPLFDVFRSDDGVTENEHSTSVYARIMLSMVSSAGYSASTARVYYAAGKDPTTTSSYINLKSYITQSQLGITQTICLGTTFSKASDYYFLADFRVGTSEIAESKMDAALRSSVPIMISSTNNGVAIGQYSSADYTTPKFEVNWPAYLYGGIAQIGDGTGSLLDLMGIQYGQTEGQKVASGGTTDYTITFPNAFAATPIVIAGLNGSLSGSSAGGLSAIVRSVTTTGCTIRVASTTTTYEGVSVSWIAI